MATSGTVAVRADSTIDVPEPELALVLNTHGKIVGYTICDDMSSRTIEGENPLYPPQAEIYLGGCAVGPAIRPVWEVADPYALPIRMTIRRGGAVTWSGETDTGHLDRRLDDLAGYLFAADVFPDGAVLATGTCLVPDLPGMGQFCTTPRLAFVPAGEHGTALQRRSPHAVPTRPPARCSPGTSWRHTPKACGSSPPSRVSRYWPEPRSRATSTAGRRPPC
ncbi:fumarylacetoacetate hydrolase family protein [Streptomyces sp. NPDC047987]|uniref:fumarylacetoacetate hydrolase family protein n=1 Tax=unclassified Streptomyces TaxID=2593676 RepID=UPI0034133090